MKIHDFLNTWEGTQAENKWSRVFISILLIAVVAMAVKAFSKETIVTMKPFSLTQEAWITKSNSSQSYKEAWGWSLSTLLGNATPGNVAFIKERLEPMLSPNIYHEVMDALELQALDIESDRIVMRFEPRHVEYEKKSKTVFVYGNSFVRGAAYDADEERIARTYEFDIEVSNYLPVISYMKTYEGAPQTVAVLAKIKAKEASELERNKRYD